MRFFLLDKVTSLVPGEQITGIKAWSLDNEIFADHFPGFPIVPGVLQTESMAQLLGILIEKSFYQEFGEQMKVYPVLSIIQKAKFRHFVSPGDVCEIQAQLSSLDRNRANGTAIIEVRGKKIADATLSFLIINEDYIADNKFIHRRDEYLYTILKDLK